MPTASLLVARACTTCPRRNLPRPVALARRMAVGAELVLGPAHPVELATLAADALGDLLPLRCREMTGLRVSRTTTLRMHSFLTHTFELPAASRTEYSITYVPGMACETLSRVTGCGSSARSAASLFKPQMYVNAAASLFSPGMMPGMRFWKRRWLSALLSARRLRSSVP